MRNKPPVNGSASDLYASFNLPSHDNFAVYAAARKAPMNVAKGAKTGFSATPSKNVGSSVV